jgi:uncharacterized protein (DUF1778 family)
MASKERAMVGGSKKKHPVSIRLSAADVAIIDRAADLRGWSRTDFVREAVVRAAEEAVMERAPIRMSPKGYNAFASAIAASAVPIPEMVELLERKAPWEASRMIADARSKSKS